MVRQTALDGALLIRIYRDNEWIEEMMYWLHTFVSRFADAGIPPHTNFFFEKTKKEKKNVSIRYKKFLDHTRLIAHTKVHVVCHLPNHHIQRSATTQEAEKKNKGSSTKTNTT